MVKKPRFVTCNEVGKGNTILSQLLYGNRLREALYNSRWNTPSPLNRGNRKYSRRTLTPQAQAHRRARAHRLRGYVSVYPPHTAVAAEKLTDHKDYSRLPNRRLLQVANNTTRPPLNKPHGLFEKRTPPSGDMNVMIWKERRARERSSRVCWLTYKVLEDVE